MFDQNAVKPSTDELINIVSRISKTDPKKIKATSRLRTDLGLDSLLSLELLVTLEEQYNLVIEQDVAAQFQTVQDIIDHLQRMK